MSAKDLRDWEGGDQGGKASEDQRERLNRWVDEHGDILYRFARKRVQDSHVIEDLLQETFLAAVRGFAGFRGEANERSWLIAILRLKIFDHFRAKSRDQGVQEIAAAQASFREDRLEAWDSSQSSSLERAEFWSIVRACVEKIPPNLGRVYLMREVDELSVHEVCETLDISRKNLAVRMFRARTLLRDCLDKNWFAAEGSS
ncbi:MAG: sigma-70 family RNA polymerase sigma factor [Pirellulaceae bacterium]